MGVSYHTGVDTDRFNITSGMFNFNNPYTISFWLKRTATTGGQQIPYYLYAASGQTEYINSTSTGLDVLTTVEYGGSQNSATSITISYNVWYHVALVRSSTSLLTLYVNDSTATNNKSISGRGATTSMQIGRGNNEYHAHAKIWTTALTVDELKNERYSIRPVHQLSSLWAWYPMIAGT